MMLELLPAAQRFRRAFEITRSRSLLQVAQARAEVDVVRLPRDHQRGHGLDPGPLGLGDPILGLPEVDVL
jgi:hypothetical protein